MENLIVCRLETYGLEQWSWVWFEERQNADTQFRGFTNLGSNLGFII